MSSKPGESFEYNNSAFGVLGELLAQKENSTWEELVQTRIFDELGMEHSYPTGENVPEELFVQGYDEESKPAGYWDMDFMNPAGSVKSCVNDQLIWLSAHLTAKENSWFAQMKEHSEIPTWLENHVMGNGWMHLITEEEHIIWHGGASGAFRSFSAFNDEDQSGVVILTNFSHYHPQMTDEKDRSIIRKFGFEILRSLSDDYAIASSSEN